MRRNWIEGRSKKRRQPCFCSQRATCRDEALLGVYFKEMSPMYHLGAGFRTEHVTSFKSHCTFFALWQLWCFVYSSAKRARLVVTRSCFRHGAFLYSLSCDFRSQPLGLHFYSYPKWFLILKGDQNWNIYGSLQKTGPHFRLYIPIWLSLFKDKNHVYFLYASSSTQQLQALRKYLSATINLK